MIVLTNNRPSPRPRKDDDDNDKTPKWIRTFLIVAITAVWATSYILGLFNPNIEIPEQVNVIFSSMVGALLLQAASRRRGGDND